MNIILFKETEAGAPLAKNDPRAIHLIKVLHKKAGDGFEAGLIGGKKGAGRIEEIFPDGSLKISLCLNAAPPEKLAIHLGVGMVRPIQMRRLLRDVCSMGVAEISVFGSVLQDKSYLQTTLFSSGGAASSLLQGLEQSRDTIPPPHKYLR
ncbi:MAG: hypothetical protein Ta2G_05880 [Termitinemataceae bacterium]|nr:MAG: hypothetical protein Ta2G_05880 [Termitinemataceae bacterium]